MKLSEAIRKGCEQSVFCTHHYRRELPDGSIGACALGAAMLGAGMKTIDELYMLYPFLDSLEDEIYHYNDYLRRSRESTADWLEEQGK